MVEQLKQVHSSRPRNPIIANVCFRGGFIDAWGSGTTRIIEECKRANLLEPEMEERWGGFIVTLHKNPELLHNAGEKASTESAKVENEVGETEKLGEKLGEKLVRIVGIMQNNPLITAVELSKQLEISKTAVENNIKKLKHLGIVERIGSDRKGKWQVNL